MSLSLHSTAAAPALPAELLHGLALRPPQARWNGLRYEGSELLGAALETVSAMTGVVAAVQRQHFLGVVAATPMHAQQAASSLAPLWHTPSAAAPLAAQSISSEQYVWQLARAPGQGEAEVVAWCLQTQASFWLPPCGADTRRTLRRELAALLQLPESALQLIGPAIAAGATEPLHLLDLLDAAADAALLSQAVARPVCVPCATGSAQAPLVLRLPAPSAAADTPAVPWPATEEPAAPLVSDAPWAVRPSLARLLSQPEMARASAQASVRDAGAVQSLKARTAALHAGVHDLNAAQVFAQESLWHEQALAQGRDPLAWRLQHLQAPVQDLARQVAERAQWHASEQDFAPVGADGRLHGRGFATAQLQTLDDSGAQRLVWSAWVAEVAVHPQTGAIEVTRVVAGHDSQQLQAAQAPITQAQIQEQDPRLLANARQLLGSAAAFDDWSSPQPTGLVPRAQPAAQPADLAALAEARLTAPGRLALDGVETLPAAAAIANAVAHATGVRLREVPFDTEQLRRSLGAPDAAGAQRRKPWGWLAAGAVGVAGLAAMAWPLKPALPLTSGPDVTLYSAQALERGRLIAAAGDCVVCHTAPGGAANAGGLGLETPFGTIYSTNITPDNETGIGRWSYAAFERAMRQGIHQDGRQLYPAFPYTAFAKLSDGDLQALYGYLLAQTPVKAQAPQTQLAFPYNLRPAMAGWNALFHDATPFKPDPARTPEWNRGAYLVEGAGHCAACHSPRNALGAEKTGIHYLGGGEAEGWKAPALNQLAEGKRPWTRDTLYQYLRSGFSPQHGVAAGPMAPVIHGLAELPDSDLRAITTYLLELPHAKPTAAVQAAPAAAAPSAAPLAVPVYAQHANGERIYQNACAVCHEAGSGPTLFGVKPLLALNTNLHAATPDNLVQVILHGIQTPANEALGHMPGFKDSLDDAQILDLTAYLRERFAPEEKAWPHDTKSISKLRAAAAAH